MPHITRRWRGSPLTKMMRVGISSRERDKNPIHSFFSGVASVLSQYKILGYYRMHGTSFWVSLIYTNILVTPCVALGGYLPDI